jgi:DNA-binding transcriptional regulator YiaG
MRHHPEGRHVSLLAVPGQKAQRPSSAAHWVSADLPLVRPGQSIHLTRHHEEVIAAARSEPDALPLTPGQLAQMRRVSRVKVLRQRLGMTQTEFAEAFHLPITTLRDWEQHRSTPTRPLVLCCW